MAKNVTDILYLTFNVNFFILDTIMCCRKVKFVFLGRNFDSWNQLKFLMWEVTGS